MPFARNVFTVKKFGYIVLCCPGQRNRCQDQRRGGGPATKGQICGFLVIFVAAENPSPSPPSNLPLSLHTLTHAHTHTHTQTHRHTHTNTHTHTLVTLDTGQRRQWTQRTKIQAVQLSRVGDLFIASRPLPSPSPLFPPLLPSLCSVRRSGGGGGGGGGGGWVVERERERAPPTVLTQQIFLKTGKRRSFSRHFQRERERERETGWCFRLDNQQRYQLRAALYVGKLSVSLLAYGIEN